MLRFLKNFAKFVSERNLWWLAPIILALLVFSAIMLLSSPGSPASPFIYAMF